MDSPTTKPARGIRFGHLLYTHNETGLLVAQYDGRTVEIAQHKGRVSILCTGKSGDAVRRHAEPVKTLEDAYRVGAEFLGVSR